MVKPVHCFLVCASLALGLSLHQPAIAETVSRTDMSTKRLVSSQEVQTANHQNQSFDAVPLNGTLVAQWVRLSDDGVLRGRVAALARFEGLPATTDPYVTETPKTQAKVLLVGQSGTLQTVTNQDGGFAFYKCKPGSYGLLIIGRKSFAAVPLHVLPASDGSGGDELARESVTGSRASRQVTVFPAVVNNDQLQGFVNVSGPAHSATPFAWEEFESDPLGPRRQTASGSTVFANDDGSFTGRFALPPRQDGVWVPLQDMHLWILRDGEVVADTVVQSDGSFRVAQLPAGEYGLVTAGASGLAAATFQLLPHPLLAGLKQTLGYVSYRSADDQLPPPGLRLEIIPADAGPDFQKICCQPFDMLEILNVTDEEVPCEPCGGATLTSCCQPQGWGGGGGGGLYGGGSPPIWPLAGLFFVPPGTGGGIVTPPQPVPEPSTLIITGLLGAGCATRYRSRKRNVVRLSSNGNGPAASHSN